MDYVILDKKTVHIDKNVKIGKNVIIYENNRIEGQSVIEDNVTIFPNCLISESIIGKGSKIYSSTIEKSEIGKCSLISPYTYIKNSKIETHSKIESFSIIKSSEHKI